MTSEDLETMVNTIKKSLKGENYEVVISEEYPSPFEQFINKLKKRENWKRYKIEITVNKDD